MGSEALERLRIADGIPLYGVDIRERDLPQETEQARALNFNKGCYVGQEIVERIRSRGNVHRKLTGLLIEGAGNVAAGEKIISEEKGVGEITSVGVVPTPTGEANCGLGLHSTRGRSAGARGYGWCGESGCDSIAFRQDFLREGRGVGVATAVRKALARSSLRFRGGRGETYFRLNREF